MSELQSKKQRIVSIDILKVLAVLTVLNSHMEPAYGDYAFLATGGAFGDALFFFASGFMLFRGACQRFDNYLKKRISRIYPTVIIVAIVGALLFDRNDNIITILLQGGGWFVSCIMIYYVLLWVVKRWLINRMLLVWIVSAIIIVAWFYLGYDSTASQSIYGETYFKWGCFFLFMLQGAVMGQNPDKYKYNHWTIAKLIGCMVLWYGILILSQRYAIIERLQYVSLIPLLGVTYYSYCFCNADFWKRIYQKKYIGQILFIVGGVCLECYLIQGFLITDKINGLFPLNIPILMLTILLVSYAVNFCSNALAQTFHKGDYEWRKCLLKKPE